MPPFFERLLNTGMTQEMSVWPQRMCMARGHVGGAMMAEAKGASREVFLHQGLEPLENIVSIEESNASKRVGKLTVAGSDKPSVT